MEKKDLDRALNRGIAVTFKTISERHAFLKEIKSFGGKWLNGKEISEEDFDNSAFPLHVDKDYLIGKISGMCFHYGAYPCVQYKKFRTDKGVIDVR